MGDLLGRLGVDPASSPQRGTVAAGYCTATRYRTGHRGHGTGQRRTAEVWEGAGGLGDQCRGAACSGVVVDVPADAGDGDRRAGRLDGFDLVVSGAGAGDPPGVFFFQAEDGIRDYKVTGVQTCALPI